MTLPTHRQDAVTEILSDIKNIVQARPVDRKSLQSILTALIELAGKPEFWNANDFPPPEEGTLHARYLISEETDQTLALYLNVMRPGNLIVPHNHTTWACIAAVTGVELNHLFERTDDGSRQGFGSLKQTTTVAVKPGGGIALLPNDIHAVEIKDDGIIRHLHLYGRALETLSDRVRFDLASGRIEPMPIGVKTRR
jgi:predicted metal-dependent enzyme (double-stranded beta helix superfamily)